MLTRKLLYWSCLKDTDHVFTTKNGEIPFSCPFCGSRKVRACFKDWYDTVMLSKEYKELQREWMGDKIYDFCNIIWRNYDANQH